MALVYTFAYVLVYPYSIFPIFFYCSTLSKRNLHYRSTMLSVFLHAGVLIIIPVPNHHAVSTLLSSSITSVGLSLTSLHVKYLLICTGHPLCSPSFLLAHAVCALVILFFVHFFVSVATSNQILVLQTSLCALSVFDLFSNHFILLPSVISSTLIILISFASQKPG